MTNEAKRAQTLGMKSSSSSSSLLLTLVASVVPCLAACSNFLDLGGNSDKEPAPSGSGTGAATPPGSTPGDNGQPKPKPTNCGTIAPGIAEVFRAPQSEMFNIMWLASDGSHVYAAGSAPLDPPQGPVTAPDPSNPMKTASLLRVPVTGGAREVIDFEHGRVSRGVTFDANNIYWASEFKDAVLMRPKAGGTITPLEMTAPSGIPQSVATDGKGNVFWATWTGEIAKIAPGTAATAQTFQTTKGDNDDASWVHADDTSVYWIAGRGELRSAPVAGGVGAPYKVLATNIAYVYHLATDADSVWGISNDELWKVSKTGGAADRVIVATAKPNRDFRAFALTDDAVYFSDDMEPLAGGGKVVKGPIYKANKDGSNLTAITPDIDGARHLTTDGCRLFWTAADWKPGYEVVVQSQGL